MEHFNFFVFSFPSNLVFALYPPSQRLKVFYVLCMLLQFLETHGCILCMSIHINLQILFLSVSLLLVLPPVPPHKHIYAPVRTLHPESLGEIQMLESVGFLKLP